jgi:hypothetical protein
MHIRGLLILALSALAACAAQPPLPSQEIFNEENASTLLVTAAPLVFARERSDAAAHARDYATLVAVEIDNSGEYREYLLVYRWSTVDRRMSPPPAPDQGALRIVADGRVIDLEPLAKLPVSFERPRDLHVPPHGDMVARAYPIDIATLEFIASSRELLVRMPHEALDTPFLLYEDGRSALSRFLERSTPAP